MEEPNKPHQEPNNRLIWLLVLTMLFSALMLVWLKQDQIQYFGQGMRKQDQSPIEHSQETKEWTTEKEGHRITANESSIQTRENRSLQESSLEKSSQPTTLEVVETTLSLEEAYANLPEPKTYTIFQYRNNQIQDRFVNRAFELLIQRLIDEGDYFNTIDYHLTVYPTLDDNIYNLGLDEFYRDQIVHKGHFRLDYRGKKVTKY